MARGTRVLLWFVRVDESKAQSHLTPSVEVGVFSCGGGGCRDWGASRELKSRLSRKAGLAALLLSLLLICLADLSLSSPPEGLCLRPRGGSGAGMFKFNFDAADDGAGGGGGGNEGIPQLPAKEENFSHLDPEEFLDEMASDALFEPIEIDDGLAIKRCRLPASETLGALAEVVENSDLAPGVYEGGFKVWEGSVDLVRHLKKNNVEMQGKRVIELGCGHGLPGIYAAMQGAFSDLQDYNVEVLEQSTFPNVVVNCRKAASPPRYFSGDWGSLSSVVGHACYDVILTAETIYSEDSVHRLIACIDELLKPEGVAYIAAKSYYFGVGGSTHRFAELVAKKMPGRKLTKGELIQDGQSNVREILVLSAAHA